MAGAGEAEEPAPEVEAGTDGSVSEGLNLSLYRVRILSSVGRRNSYAHSRSAALQLGHLSKKLGAGRWGFLCEFPDAREYCLDVCGSGLQKAPPE